ncbi:MAG: ABC transporter ATP-binding protein [Chloroflexota bacterium]
MLDVAIKKQLGNFNLDASFTAGDGVVALFGPSGAGKSLTLQCIAGLLAPDAGLILINGQPAYDAARGINVPAQARGVGYVFQSYALFPHLTVWENVAYGLHRLPREARAATVEKMLALMRLQGLERRRPDELSGGQRQRVALARALAPKPQVLLLDEPFSALDSPIRGRLREEVLPLLRGVAITTVLVTHDLREAYALSQQMVVYDAGRVLQTGSREEVLRRPNSRAVARFVGTKNLFRGVVGEATADQLALKAGNLVVRAPAGPYRAGDEVDFCIRPEEIMLIRPDRELGAAVQENRYPAEITGEVAHGPSFTLLVKLTGNPLCSQRHYDLHLEIPANAYYRLGADLEKRWVVSLKQESIHVIGRASRRQAEESP